MQTRRPIGGGSRIWPSKNGDGFVNCPSPRANTGPRIAKKVSDEIINPATSLTQDAIAQKLATSIGKRSAKEANAIHIRPYQQELYERASRDNVIAVLPTGEWLIATLSGFD